jgi:hypothetical protein
MNLAVRTPDIDQQGGQDHYDIVYQHPAEVGAARAYIGDELLEPFALIGLQPAEPVISVGPDDVEAISSGIGRNCCRLVLDRLPLVNVRHSHVLCGAVGEVAPDGWQLCAAHDEGLCHRPRPSNCSTLAFCAQIWADASG